jgi:hypothetical protein
VNTCRAQKLDPGSFSLIRWSTPAAATMDGASVSVAADEACSGSLMPNEKSLFGQDNSLFCPKFSLRPPPAFNTELVVTMDGMGDRGASQAEGAAGGRESVLATKTNCPPRSATPHHRYARIRYAHGIENHRRGRAMKSHYRSS